MLLGTPDGLKLMGFKGIVEDNIKKYRLNNGKHIFGVNTDRISKLLENGENYELHIEKLARKILRPNSIIFDIGANIGYHSLVFSELTGNQGKVFSFDGQKFLSELLIKTISENNLSNIQVVSSPVLDKEGEKLYFRFIPFFPCWCNIVDKNYFKLAKKKHPSSVFKSYSITLDNFVRNQNLNRLDLIKVDIDGFEYKALNGGMEAISKFKPKIIWEFNKDFYEKTGNDTIEILEKFEKLGYKFAIISDLVFDFSSSNWYVTSKEFINFINARAIDSIDIILSTEIL